MLKLIQNKKKGGEKAFRYSLRKFKFGAASVLVGLTFLGFGAEPVSANYEIQGNYGTFGDSASEAKAAGDTMSVSRSLSPDGKRITFTVIFNKNNESWTRPPLSVYLPKGLKEETVRIKTYNAAARTGGGEL